MKNVRTRFAPSPTGFVHVGSIRTALFAWLVARQNNGQFILRIEDTDQQRQVGGATEHIIDSLRLLGLNYDEGPDVGGQFGPYIQSQRLSVYQDYARQLIDSGQAYADPYSPNQIQAWRDQATAAKKPFLYRHYRPEKPPVWDGRQPLRFRSNPKSYSWQDQVMGQLSASAEAVDDFILIKSDGFPTYNFAHIVDDATMKISHVIRGQEFVASLPNYLNLMEALHLKRPIFATMPHILNDSGHKKLSKRDGARDVLDYLAEGILVEALINFIASLGWNDGTEQEIFSRQELIEKFSLSRVQKSGARFDERRLSWFNGQWLRRLEIDQLMKRAAGFWGQHGALSSDKERRSALSLVQNRLRTLTDLPSLSEFLFAEPTVDWSIIEQNRSLAKLGRSRLLELLKITAQALSKLPLPDWTDQQIQSTLNDLLKQAGTKPAELFSLVRLALTFAPFSPGLAETMTVLGRQKTLARIERTINQA
jgi:glutamyl-tRNA synthetase